MENASNTMGVTGTHSVTCFVQTTKALPAIYTPFFLMNPLNFRTQLYACLIFKSGIYPLSYYHFCSSRLFQIICALTATSARRDIVTYHEVFDNHERLLPYGQQSETVPLLNCHWFRIWTKVSDTILLKSVINTGSNIGRHEKSIRRSCITSPTFIAWTSGLQVKLQSRHGPVLTVTVLFQ
jgi:hypothetical protein